MVVFMSACPGESAITRKGSLASSLAVAPALRKLCDVMPSDIPSARRRRRQSVGVRRFLGCAIGRWENKPPERVLTDTCASLPRVAVSPD